MSLTSVTFLGSNITASNFDNNAFRVDSGSDTNLKTAYASDGAGTYTRPASNTNWVITFTDISAFGTWLGGKLNTSSFTAYNVKLNISSLGGSSSTSGSLGAVLIASSNLNSSNLTDRYVNLDLSGSTFTSIPSGAFKNCRNLSGITIGNSVTTIEAEAFASCISDAFDSITIPTNVTFIGQYAFTDSSLTCVRFLGPDIQGIDYAFDGGFNLYSVYYPNGGAGTYTRTSSSGPWTKTGS
jgi:hypothetical protein